MKHTLLILLVSVTATLGDFPYSFTNFVGLPGGPGSADGTGSTARFNNPEGIALDSAGNIYVADTYNATVRKITPDGTVTTLAGSASQRGSADGTGSAARFSALGLTGITVDSAGNVYVADRNNHTIRKITPDGTVTTLAGRAEDVDGDGYPDGGYADGIGANALFDRPSGVALDSVGNVYVSDTRNQVIRKITQGGEVTTLAGSPGESGRANGVGSEARFSDPLGVAVDAAGIIYVADNSPNSIRKITPDGMVTTLGSTTVIFGAANLGAAYGLAVDRDGTVYVSENQYGPRIRKVTTAGTATTLAGPASGNDGNTDGTGSAARFNFVLGLAVDSAGNVYVADSQNSTIRKVTPAGVVTTFAGSSGYGSVNGTGTAARFYRPTGVALDSAGNLYIADSDNQTVRKATPEGKVTTLAGSARQNGYANGAGSTARFWGPQGVAVDSAGNVYVGEGPNETVRKITPAGVVSTLAGRAGQTGSDDGIGSVARFGITDPISGSDSYAGPAGMAIDNVGNLYVSDFYNHTIRKITPAGEVSTLAGSAGEPGSANGVGNAARFNLPQGVAVDSAGNVYVADYKNHEIRKITPDGSVTTLAGNASITNDNGDSLGGYADGISSAARFNYPRGVAVDTAGNVFVADTGNNLIRRITPDGTVTTIAGTAGQRGGADGIGSAALFDQPWGVAVDGAGNLYVADKGNNRITKGTPVSPSGSSKMQIVRVADVISISWPAAAVGFVLETTDSLSSPRNWTSETTIPMPVADQNAVTIKIGSSSQFFRLRKP